MSHAPLQAYIPRLHPSAFEQTVTESLKKQTESLERLEEAVRHNGNTLEHILKLMNHTALQGVVKYLKTYGDVQMLSVEQSTSRVLGESSYGGAFPT
jgi:hypothetical protein